jgi:hypothetical protein
MSATIHTIYQESKAGEVSIRFPRSAVCQFYAERNALTLEAEELKKYLRVGQHFHNYMQLHKVVSPANKAWADKLHAADSNTARRMIIDRTDWTC